jgi:phage shock protein C
MTRPFTLEREQAKLMGVCAGFARWSDLDPLAVRLLTILSLFILGPLTIIAYLVIGWLAPQRA